MKIKPSLTAWCRTLHLAMVLFTTARGQQTTAAKFNEPEAEVLARGRYMIVIGHCNNCHTPDYQKLAGKVPEKDWLIGRDVGYSGPLGTNFPANLRIKVNQMKQTRNKSVLPIIDVHPFLRRWNVGNIC